MTSVNHAQSRSPKGSMVTSVSPLAVIACKPRQVRKEATVASGLCAEVWLAEGIAKSVTRSFCLKS